LIFVYFNEWEYKFAFRDTSEMAYKLEIHVWSHAMSGYTQSMSTRAIKRRTIVVKAKRGPVAASFPQAEEKKKVRSMFNPSVRFLSSF